MKADLKPTVLFNLHDCFNFPNKIELVWLSSVIELTKRSSLICV